MVRFGFVAKYRAASSFAMTKTVICLGEQWKSVETTLNFSKEAKDSHLTSALFYKDKVGKMDVVHPLAQDTNTGLKQRHTFTRESKSVAMEGIIHSDLFAQDRYILGAVPIKIKLVRSVLFGIICRKSQFQSRRMLFSCTTS